MLPIPITFATPYRLGEQLGQGHGQEIAWGTGCTKRPRKTGQKIKEREKSQGACSLKAVVTCTGRRFLWRPQLGWCDQPAERESCSVRILQLKILALASRKPWVLSPSPPPSPRFQQDEEVHLKVLKKVGITDCHKTPVPPKIELCFQMEKISTN